MLARKVEGGCEYQAVALYSGGVDSTAAPLLVRDKVSPILLLMVDLGDDSGVARAAQRAEVLGMDFKVLDGKAPFAANYLSEAIRMNGNYWGYPLITPLSRAYIMEVAASFLPADQESYIIHGCTAKQNTRFRIERACSQYPHLVPIGPFVSNPQSRKEKIKFLRSHGIESGDGGEYAEDVNIWGRAIEGEPLNNLDDVETLGVYTLTNSLDQTPDKPHYFSLNFVDGVPVAVDGVEEPLEVIIEHCSRLGALHGVGRIRGFEDTIPELGYKEMGIYESPASEVIYATHRYIEAAVLTYSERKQKRGMEQDWGEVVYRGGWADSDRRELSELVRPLQAKVRGRVEVKLYKGHILIANADIPDHRLVRKTASVGAY